MVVKKLEVWRGSGAGSKQYKVGINNAVYFHQLNFILGKGSEIMFFAFTVRKNGSLVG